MKDPTLYAIPAFFILMVVEAWAAASRGRSATFRGYEWRDTLASLSMGVGNRVIVGAIGLGIVWLELALYEHRLFDLGNAWWVWVLCSLVEDLAYYCFHRASHEVRFLWAAHVNHHSSQRYNLSTALRQPWTTPFTHLLFYWPLPLLGFHPTMIVLSITISLLYQFWIHTELIDRLGVAETILNTPSHHRVHHGVNLEYLDRNHGGILILWDKLFGTFEPERARVRYGLTKNIESFNPLQIAFHEWIALVRDVRGARSWREALGFLFLPPGWSPDGSSLTANQMRAAALVRQDPTERSPKGATSPAGLAAALLAILALAATLCISRPAQAGGDWNDSGIAWKGYDEGLALAKKDKKPLCLIFYTEWCPHCSNYSKLFHDKDVVEAAKNLVMVRLDQDKNKELGAKYEPDGGYIPRTLFLSPEGTLDASIHASRDKFQFFFDEKDPASVLAGMKQAQSKLK